MVLAYGGWPVAGGTYYPFGVEIGSSASPNHYKFSGKDRDAASGLDDFGARYYSAVMGRFMTPDWSASPEPVPYAKLDNPQSLNLYSYVENNPLTGIDADGHCDGVPANGTVSDPNGGTQFRSAENACPSVAKAKVVQKNSATTKKAPTAERIALGVESVANIVVGVPKAAEGAAALVVGTIGSETGVGVGVAAAGSYELVQGSGQLTSAMLQGHAAITGDTTGVEEKTDQISATTSIAGLVGTKLNHGDYHAGAKYAAAEGVFSGALTGDLVEGTTHIIDTIMNLKDLVTQ